jgi:hypothetical protein
MEASVTPADTTRRQLLALALPVTAVLLLIGEALTPAGLDQTPMSAAAALPLLPKAAAHVNQLYLSNALVLLGLGTLLISYLALTQLARLRGATLATTAAAIGCLAAFAGIVANVLAGFNLATAVSAGLPATQAADFVARSFSAKAGEAFLNTYFLGNIVALVLMAVALWLSRNVPWWLAILLPVTFELVGFAPAGPVAIAWMLPFLILSAELARRIWTQARGVEIPVTGELAAVARPLSG